MNYPIERKPLQVIFTDMSLLQVLNGNNPDIGLAISIVQQGANVDEHDDEHFGDTPLHISVKNHSNKQNYLELI